MDQAHLHSLQRYWRQHKAFTTAALARDYVEQAPEQVRTPFRHAFEEQLGWKRDTSFHRYYLDV